MGSTPVCEWMLFMSRAISAVVSGRCALERTTKAAAMPTRMQKVTTMLVVLIYDQPKQHVDLPGVKS